MEPSNAPETDSQARAESDRDDLSPRRTRRFWLDWSWRRRRLTILYVVVGVLLGMLLPVVVVTVVGLLWAFAFGRMFAVPTAVVTVSLGSVVTLAALFEGSRGTCARNPVAPGAAAAGTFAGALALSALTAFLTLQSPRFPLVAVLALVAPVMMAWAVVVGGRMGLRKNLGTPAMGVGVLCATCGYDVGSVGDHKPCPECASLWRYPRRAVDLNV